jgi:hypothetical protein
MPWSCCHIYPLLHRRHKEHEARPASATAQHFDWQWRNQPRAGDANGAIPHQGWFRSAPPTRQKLSAKQASDQYKTLHSLLDGKAKFFQTNLIVTPLVVGC